jgi:hypothetical protein
VPGGINWTCRWWRRGRGKGVILCLVGYDGTKYGEGRCTFFACLLAFGSFMSFFFPFESLSFSFFVRVASCCFFTWGYGMRYDYFFGLLLFCSFLYFQQGTEREVNAMDQQLLLFAMAEHWDTSFFLAFFFCFSFLWDGEMRRWEGDDGIGYQ